MMGQWNSADLAPEQRHVLTFYVFEKALDAPSPSPDTCVTVLRAQQYHNFAQTRRSQKGGSTARKCGSLDAV